MKNMRKMEFTFYTREAAEQYTQSDLMSNMYVACSIEQFGAHCFILTFWYR